MTAAARCTCRKAERSGVWDRSARGNNSGATPRKGPAVPAENLKNSIEMLVVANPPEKRAGRTGLTVVVSLEDVLRLTARGEHFVLDLREAYGGAAPDYVQIAFHPNPPALAADLLGQSSRVATVDVDDGTTKEIKTPEELEALRRDLRQRHGGRVATPTPAEASTLGMPLSHKDEQDG